MIINHRENELNIKFDATCLEVWFYYCLFVCLFVFIGHRVSCILSWPQTHCVINNTLKVFPFSWLHCPGGRVRDLSITSASKWFYTNSKCSNITYSWTSDFQIISFIFASIHMQNIQLILIVRGTSYMYFLLMLNERSKRNNWI